MSALLPLLLIVITLIAYQPVWDAGFIWDDNDYVTENPTLRDLMEQHSQNPTCFACHGVMDPLGFAMENFDAVGQYREMDRMTRTILDTSGKLPDGTRLRGVDDLRNALLAKPEQFIQTITTKLMIYGLGRPVEYHDMPTVREIVRKAAADDYRFSNLITQIVTSDAFLKTAPPEQPADEKKSIQAALPR